MNQAKELHASAKRLQKAVRTFGQSVKSDRASEMVRLIKIIDDESASRLQRAFALRLLQRIAA